MSRSHAGLLDKRSRRKVRPLRLGGYLILTDTAETESNYFQSMKDRIPKELQSDLQIKIYKGRKTEELRQEAQRIADKEPRFREVWLIFDRDFVPDFDQLIHGIESDGHHCGWSNPCFELWLSAYFGEMKPEGVPKQCEESFKKLLVKYTSKKEYKKSDRDLYAVLVKSGDENGAIQLAERRYENFRRKMMKPSEMLGCTTVYQLVRELRNKMEL